MTDIIIHAVDNRFIKINSTADILSEISDRFSYMATGFRHNPKFKIGLWDGRIKLFNRSTRKIGRGLLHYVLEYATNNNYSVELVGFEEPSEPVTIEALKGFVDGLGLPEHIETRDYQLDTLHHCVNAKRALMVSPTASGKSKMIYEFIRWFGKRALIIVPRKALVRQMAGDFVDYGYDAANIHQIFSGQEKNTDSLITVTTWQSLMKMPEEWFEQFETVIGDECHKFKAAELRKIMEKINAPYRIAYTGSLDGEEVNQLLIESLFGPYKQFITTSEMIEQGYGANLRIKAVQLKYPEEIRQAVCGGKKIIDYKDEISYLVSLPARNRFIVNLAKSLKGNTIILYRYVEKHGDILFPMMQKHIQDRPLYYINGSVELEDREYVRKIINTHDDSITVASLGTFAEGINIPRLHNVIIAHPTKSRVEVMQLIGRGLRRTEDKDSMTLFDIGDDMSVKKKKTVKMNHTLRHFLRRIEIYNEEKFNYRMYSLEVKTKC